MKSQDDKAKEEITEARILIAALKQAGMYPDEWIIERFGTARLDVGDRWVK